MTQKLIMMYWILQVSKSVHIHNSKTKSWDSVTNWIFCSELHRSSSLVTPGEISWGLTGWNQQAQEDIIHRHQQMHPQWNTSASRAAELSTVTPGPQKALVKLEG